MSTNKKVFDKIEHEYNKCTRIRMKNNEKYINKNFETYYLKRNIRREFIIVENSQINDCAKRLNQLLIRKINFMLKNLNINLYRNIFYKFFTNYFFNYDLLKRIDQRNEYQIIKLSINYKKFVDYQALDIFVIYENEHIYRIIIEKKTKLNEFLTSSNKTINARTKISIITIVQRRNSTIFRSREDRRKIYSIAIRFY